MRVLILVLSCNKPPYDALHDAQRRTWDSPGIVGTVHYYWCDRLTDTILCLRQALEDVQGWDFVFRTNSSSYVDKERLVTHAEMLPREGCYQGVDGGGFASGSGFFVSKDVVDVLREIPLPSKQDDIDLLARGGDDVYIGRFLRGRGIPLLHGAERYDFWQREFERQFHGRSIREEEVFIRDAYHVRCKCDADREKDAVAMEAVFEIKMR